jgi:hypothetical protein
MCARVLRDDLGAGSSAGLEDGSERRGVRRGSQEADRWANAGGARLLPTGPARE